MLFRSLEQDRRSIRLGAIGIALQKPLRFLKGPSLGGTSGGHQIGHGHKRGFRGWTAVLQVRSAPIGGTLTRLAVVGRSKRFVFLLTFSGLPSAPAKPLWPSDFERSHRALTTLAGRKARGIARWRFIPLDLANSTPVGNRFRAPLFTFRSRLGIALR